MERMVQAKESTAEAERRVEDLLCAVGVAEEREKAKERRESSSDLFELKSLPVSFDDAEPPRLVPAANKPYSVQPRQVGAFGRLNMRGATVAWRMAKWKGAIVAPGHR